MKIAIISDIHDNVWKLKAVINAVNQIDVLICCGDLCSPFIVDLMATNFSKEIHIIFGNNDGDLYRITQNAAKYKNEEGKDRVLLHGQFYSDEIDSKKIAVNHYPEIASPIAESGAYDLVCYGHNHKVKKETKGSTLLINPGSVMGYNPLTDEDVLSTFAVYNTSNGEIKFYKLRSDLNNTETVVEFSIENDRA